MNCLWGKLEIGNGPKKIKNFLTTNIQEKCDVVSDCRELPFKSESFEIIYASHVLEHVPWFQTLDTLKEWVRCLKIGGCLEIWVPDFLKIYREYLEGMKHDKWRKFNRKNNRHLYLNGRVFAYGKEMDDPNWHKSLFTRESLQGCLIAVGLSNVGELNKPRAYDHGWINLGLRGEKL